MAKDPLVLCKNPTLADYQSYISKMVRLRGFHKNTIYQEFTLMMEECGELAKAARKQTKMRTDAKSDLKEIAHEAADVFIYLLGICNRFDVDLEKAFREKEALNKQRVWK